MANQPIVGRDAQVYLAQGYGSSLNPTGGASVNLLSVWKDVSFEVNNDWVDRTPSSATTVIKRKTTGSAKISLKHVITQLGNQAGPLINANDMIYVLWTEISSGNQMYFYGGISSIKLEYGKDTGDESIEAETVSYALDGTSFPWGYTN